MKKLNKPKLNKPRLTRKSKKSRTVTLSWKKVKGAKGYIVYRSTSKKGKYKKIKKISNAKTVQYKDKTVKKKKKYYYKIVAFGKYNGVTIYSKASSIKSITLK